MQECCSSDRRVTANNSRSCFFFVQQKLLFSHLSFMPITTKLNTDLKSAKIKRRKINN